MDASLSVFEVLTKGKKLIEVPGTWIRYIVAVNRFNIRVNPLTEDACKFCSEGALVRASGGDRARFMEAHSFLRNAAGRPLCRFNDDPTYTHNDILELWDIAIAKAKEAEHAPQV